MTALLVDNLLSPVVLAFVLGLVACLARSDLRLPEPVFQALSIYLLFAIGMKGGAAVAEAGLAEAYDSTDVVVAANAEFTDQGSLHLNVGPSDPPIRMREAQLEGLGAQGGGGGGDLVLPIGGGLGEAQRQGGAHLLDRLLKGGSLTLTATGEITALHPRRDLQAQLDLEHIGSGRLLLHRAIYGADPALGGIVHTHSTHAVALACLREDLPPFHYMVAMAGGRDIRCSDYATFGTEALSLTAVQALQGRMACLLANHGLIACGPDLGRAETLAVEVEHLCEAYLKARAAGTPVLLTDADITEALARFDAYRRGQLD